MLSVDNFPLPICISVPTIPLTILYIKPLPVTCMTIVLPFFTILIRLIMRTLDLLRLVPEVLKEEKSCLPINNLAAARMRDILSFAIA